MDSETPFAGMLSGSFPPDAVTLRLRTITRHRQSLVETVAKYTLKVQKCLRLMNVRLDVAIRDVAGKSGRAIITSILAGERSAQALAALADPRVKKSQKELAELLNGQWNEELLYELKDCYELMELHDRKAAAAVSGYRAGDAGSGSPNQRINAKCRAGKEAVQRQA